MSNATFVIYYINDNYAIFLLHLHPDRQIADRFLLHREFKSAASDRRDNVFRIIMTRFSCQIHLNAVVQYAEETADLSIVSPALFNGDINRQKVLKVVTGRLQRRGTTA